MHRLQYLLLLFLCLLFCSPNDAAAAGAAWPISDSPRFWILGREAWHVSLEFSSYISSSNYDQQGLVYQPTNMTSLQFINPRFHVGYGLNRKVSVFAQIAGSYVTTNNIAPVSSGSYGGLGDAFVAIRWQVYRLRTPLYDSADWLPQDFQALLEGSWNFPLYNHVASLVAPQGNESNDFTGMLRMAWYATRSFAFSGGLGLTMRTNSYGAELPYFLRVDFIPATIEQLRFWLDLYGEKRLSSIPNSLNAAQSDPIPGGSYLFKNTNYSQEKFGLGSSYLFSKDWELAAAYHNDIAGINASKGYELALALTYRPYKVIHIRNELENKKEEEERVVEKWRKRDAVTVYGFTAIIQKVSDHGNFFKIELSENDEVKPGDAFHVFRPSSKSFPERKLVAAAKIVRIDNRDAFLRVEENFVSDIFINPGYEAQRIISTE